MSRSQSTEQPTEYPDTASKAKRWQGNAKGTTSRVPAGTLQGASVQH